VGPVRPEITQKLIKELLEDRMLHASLLSKSDDPKMSHAAAMVFFTLQALQKELTRRLR
jgi:hypothetical protein